MGRHALVTTTPAEDGLSEDRLAEAGAATAEKALIDRATEAAVEIGQTLGQLETFSFFASVGNSGALAAYEKLKKSKTWQILANPQNPTGGKFESLDEFCRVKMGLSYNRIQGLISNRNAVTQELYDQSEKLGLRQADYNAIKALPLPDREAVQAAIADGSSREDVIAVLLDISAKVTTLTTTVDGLVADNTANETLLDDRAKKIDNLERKLKKGVVALTDWPAALTPLASQINHSGDKIKISLGELEQMRLQAMQTQPEPGEEASMEQARRMLARKFDEVLQAAAEQIEAIKHGFDNTLGAWVEGQDVGTDVAQAAGNGYAAD